MEQERARLAAENVYLREEIQSVHNLEEIVGQSPALLDALEKVSRVAKTDATVLITGETGTGKELIARAIHSASHRQGKPLIKLNCAALPAGLVESELFGHEKGRFPERSAAGWAGLSWRTAERFSWMRSAEFRPTFRSNSSASSRSVNSSASAEPIPSKSMSA
jgi:transcriptional regulator with PAS, ATPase and Fis domain